LSTSVVLKSQSVESTMLLPLWGRATYSRKDPAILDDQDAIRLIKQCEYDFAPVAKSFGEFSGLTYIARARRFDDAIRNYLAKHPRATVVNIGAGLDTTFSRIDNGLINYYNLDLPDAIAYRKSLLEDTPRNTCIAKNFLDPSWFDDIIFNMEDGIVFISAGVFYYFKEEQLKTIIAAMAQRFSGGELYFDAEPKYAVKGSNRMVEKSGNKGAMMHFWVNNNEQLEQWSPNIRVSSQSLLKGITMNESWGIGTRLAFRACNCIKFMKLICLKFAH
jgi:O-methyltransferase involved in polyketide biosynthesis